MRAKRRPNCVPNSEATTSSSRSDQVGYDDEHASVRPSSVLQAAPKLSLPLEKGRSSPPLLFGLNLRGHVGAATHSEWALVCSVTTAGFDHRLSPRLGNAVRGRGNRPPHTNHPFTCASDTTDAQKLKLQDCSGALSLSLCVGRGFWLLASFLDKPVRVHNSTALGKSSLPSAWVLAREPKT